MMSEWYGFDLIKKEIKVDVCYFQLHVLITICQSQPSDCFGPTAIQVLSK